MELQLAATVHDSDLQWDKQRPAFTAKTLEVYFSVAILHC